MASLMRTEGNILGWGVDLTQLWVYASAIAHSLTLSFASPMHLVGHLRPWFSSQACHQHGALGLVLLFTWASASPSISKAGKEFSLCVWWMKRWLITRGMVPTSQHTGETWEQQSPQPLGQFLWHQHTPESASMGNCPLQWWFEAHAHSA